jgi:hypothetical protein
MLGISRKQNIDAALWFNSPDAFGDDYGKFLIEEYKIYVDTTNKTSDRPDTMCARISRRRQDRKLVFPHFGRG